jgi:hypothetical protein
MTRTQKVDGNKFDMGIGRQDTLFGWYCDMLAGKEGSGAKSKQQSQSQEGRNQNN